MNVAIAPLPALSDWTFRVVEFETEEVSLPCIEGWPSWQPVRTLAVVQMTAKTWDACAVPRGDLIGKGFVLLGMQHQVLQVLDTNPLKVRTQAKPVEVEARL